MSFKKLQFSFLALCVISIYQIVGFSLKAESSTNVKVAISTNKFFSGNSYIKDSKTNFSQERLLELFLSNLNSTGAMANSNSSSNSTDNSYFQAVQQRFYELEEVVRDLQARLLKIGTSYIRWGRTHCHAEDTELVYSGYVGGSHYTHSGGSVDYVCLPPDKLNFSSLESYAYNYMYGAEYEINGPLIQHDVPCAVCRSTSYTTTLMVSGRNQCYDKWKVIYHGNLMAGKHDHTAASSFICLDSNPESLYGGGNVDNNGILLYPVRAQCGSLKCPPYINDATLTCVVCGK